MVSGSISPALSLPLLLLSRYCLVGVFAAKYVTPFNGNQAGQRLRPE